VCSQMDLCHCKIEYVQLKPVASIGVWGLANPPKKVTKDFCHSGESVLDLTFIRMM